MKWTKTGRRRVDSGTYRIDKNEVEKLIPDDERLERETARYMLDMAKWEKAGRLGDEPKPPKLKLIRSTLTLYAAYHGAALNPIVSSWDLDVVADAVKSHAQGAA